MFWATAVTNTVGKMIASDWAIAAVVIGIILFDGVDHRPADLHGFIEGLSLYTISAVMTGTAFDHFHHGFRNKAKELGGLWSHVLGSGMAGKMYSDPAIYFLQLAT